MNAYSYTTGEVDESTAVTTAYSYSSTYPDRLTNFGGKGVSYNSIGYPINHDGMSYVWTKGKLTRQFCGSKTQAGTLYKDTTFTYDAYGRRLSKSHTYDTNPALTSDYSYTYNTTYTYDNGGRLVHETCVEAFTYSGGTSRTREIIYLYDESDIVGAVQTYNGTTETYYFDRNIRGDVTAIYNNSGTKVASYIYDAWGNCTTKTLVSNNFSSYNPIRYRGYYYDRETGLYYLNARYYNPQWRRFISPDSTEYLDPEAVNGLNLYAYCNNDPVNYADPSGHFVVSAWIVGMVLGFGIGFVSSVASDLIFEDEVNIGKAIVSGMFGAMSGGLANTAVSFTSLIISNALLSAGNSIVDDVVFDKNTDVDIIIGNALISAGMSALFTLAIGNPNSSNTSKLYKNAKYADGMINKGGVHPNVKSKFYNDVDTYNKELKKIAIGSIKEALSVSPVEKFTTRVYKAYYKLFFVR